MTLERLLYSVPAILIAMVLHELAHGYVSYRLGDPTPKETGRLSLNPLRHLDPLGSLMLLFVGFGWAKPVMINPNYYKNRKWGTVLVSLAGPLTNFVLAFIGALLMTLIYKINGSVTITFETELQAKIFYYLWEFLYYFMLLNIGLGVFNLIPFPPLDGSKILAAVLPDRLYFTWMRYERYGQFVLIVILYAGLLDKPLTFLRSNILGAMLLAAEWIFRIG